MVNYIKYNRTVNGVQKHSYYTTTVDSSTIVQECCMSAATNLSIGHLTSLHVIIR